TGTSTEYLSDPVSFDCPPSAGTVIGIPQTANVQLQTGNQTLTLSAANPNCRAVGWTGNKCFCDTCNNAASTTCSTDADCTAVGATTCGGKRCVGGPNAGTPCSNSSECPS